ncbi:MAG: DUF3592 domain-containing protein [Terracidiphilus sp.]|jgi:hypothetical protein
MGTFRFAGAGGLILGAFALFALGITSFVHSGRDASLAANQRMSTAQGTKTYTTTRDSSGHTHSHIDCAYHFKVDETLYNGNDCPADDPTESFGKHLLDEYAGPQKFTATVYYDPTDPSTNSLTEFAARSGYDNQMGILFIGVGIILLGLVAMGALMSNNQSSIPTMSEAPTVPSTVPEQSSPSGQQFLDDLDKVLRSEEPTDHSSAG